MPSWTGIPWNFVKVVKCSPLLNCSPYDDKFVVGPLLQEPLLGNGSVVKLSKSDVFECFLFFLWVMIWTSKICFIDALLIKIKKKNLRMIVAPVEFKDLSSVLTVPVHSVLLAHVSNGELSFRRQSMLNLKPKSLADPLQPSNRYFAVAIRR